MDDRPQELRQAIGDAKVKIADAIIELQRSLPEGLCVSSVDVDLVDITSHHTNGRKTKLSSIIIQVAG